LLGGLAEAPDQLAGQVLQRGHGAGAAVVVGRPDVQGEERVEDLGQFSHGHVIVAVHAGGGGRYQGPFRLRFKVFEGDQARVKAVFHVVDRVGHVVGPVHDLRFQASLPVRGAGPDPGEDLGVLGVDAELGAGGRAEPGVLQGRVEGGPGEVQPGAFDLGLEPGQQAQGLRVAFEPAARGGQLVEGEFAVMAERAVADVVSQAGRVHQIRVATDLAA
jgi:hypothetical protein